MRDERISFGQHIQINPKIEHDDNSGVLRVEFKSAVRIVERTDNLILDGIRQIAQEAGITDLYLLDKEKITEALRKQIPMEPIRTDKFGRPYVDGVFECPGCGVIVNTAGKPMRYCIKCGQALDWGQEDGQ